MLAELRRRSPALYFTGWIHIGLLAAMLAVAPFDSRSIMGLNPWIKPMKFAASIALYAWTLSWLLGYLRRPVKLVGIGVSVSMLVEIACICLQAFRGTTSHYNDSTPFNLAVFNLMGLMILLNTVFVFIAFSWFLQERPPLEPGYLWGIRLGLFLFALGSLEGLFMISQSAHTVGLPDGGPGLPFMNWSTLGGDLRVAHFLGLHSLQALPLAGYWMSRAFPRVQTTAVALFAAAWAGAIAALLVQAIGGQPLIGTTFGAMP